QALFNFANHSGYQYVTVSRERGGGFQNPFRIIPPPALDLTPNDGLATWGNNDKDSPAVCDDYSHTPNILSFAQHPAWVQEHVFGL
ncbi:hypothetical protein KUCAC02_025733, partial [Chaenocephalus aceratus]